MIAIMDVVCTSVAHYPSVLPASDRWWSSTQSSDCFLYILGAANAAIWERILLNTLNRAIWARHCIMVSLAHAWIYVLILCAGVHLAFGNAGQR